MVKNVMPKGEWKEVAELYVRGGKQFYILRVNPQEKDDMITSIEDVYDHEPTGEDKTALYAAWLTSEKKVKIAEVVQYAKTDAVKMFEVNGIKGWLDSEERGSIRRAAADKSAEGREIFVLYLSGHGIEMSPSKVEEMLKEVEVYASDCFDRAEEHKSVVLASDNIEFVNGYDVTTGYPEHPIFNV